MQKLLCQDCGTDCELFKMYELEDAPILCSKCSRVREYEASGELFIPLDDEEGDIP